MTWHGPGQRIIYFMIDIKKEIRYKKLRIKVRNLYYG